MPVSTKIEDAFKQVDADSLDLSPKQIDKMQDKINALKTEVRIENEQYLKRHPEINSIVGYVVKQLLIEMPENALSYICNKLSEPGLQEKIDEHVEESDECRRFRQQVFDHE